MPKMFSLKFMLKNFFLLLFRLLCYVCVGPRPYMRIRWIRSWIIIYYPLTEYRWTVNINIFASFFEVRQRDFIREASPLLLYYIYTFYVLNKKKNPVRHKQWFMRLRMRIKRVHFCCHYMTCLELFVERLWDV